MTDLALYYRRKVLLNEALENLTTKRHELADLAITQGQLHIHAGLQEAENLDEY